MKIAQSLPGAAVASLGKPLPVEAEPPTPERLSRVNELLAGWQPGGPGIVAGLLAGKPLSLGGGLARLPLLGGLSALSPYSLRANLAPSTVSTQAAPGTAVPKLPRLVSHNLKAWGIDPSLPLVLPKALLTEQSRLAWPAALYDEAKATEPRPGWASGRQQLENADHLLGAGQGALGIAHGFGYDVPYTHELGAGLDVVEGVVALGLVVSEVFKPELKGAKRGFFFVEHVTTVAKSAMPFLPIPESIKKYVETSLLIVKAGKHLHAIDLRRTTVS